MKKTILLVAASLATMVTSAQMTSKNGSAILPESGDWSIGVNVNPFLDYVGHIFSDAGAVSPSFNWTQGNTWVITGKMMKDANTAYRAKVRIGLESGKDELQTVAEGIISADSATVKTSSNNITLGAGIQKYRGKGRLQGIYGAEASISIGGGKTTWDGTDNNISFSRELKSASTFKFGVRGFLGAEYFFAPKMSMGGEFGWGISLASTGEGTDTQTVGSTTTKSATGKSSDFTVGTDNLEGAISLNFYF